jgi:hypothetical protein
LLCKRISFAKSEEMKTGCNLAESSKEGYGSKRGCFANDDDNDDTSAPPYVFMVWYLIK